MSTRIKGNGNSRLMGNSRAAAGPTVAAVQERLWAVVLAGGKGMRLCSLTRRLYGEDRPKQYAALVGSRSLLRHTLDRVTLIIPSERTVVVTSRAHTRYVAAEFLGAAGPKVLPQPEDRGTAAGVLLPTHWISWRDPEATVAVFPSDHFVLEESAFMGHVAEVAGFVERHPEWIVLLGAQPTHPETEYGWVEPAEALERTTAGPICRVRRFWEKPSTRTAVACLERGCLWNTFVFVAKASALIEAGRQFLPSLHERLARITPFAGTEDEGWAIQQAYALAPTANFSRAVLESCPPFLAVSRLPTLTWSDWGTPQRVVQTLKGAGIIPPGAGLWISPPEPPATRVRPA